MERQCPGCGRFGACTCTCTAADVRAALESSRGTALATGGTVDVWEIEAWLRSEGEIR